jgi:hypothetical protein
MVLYVEQRTEPARAYERKPDGFPRAFPDKTAFRLAVGHADQAYSARPVADRA